MEKSLTKPFTFRNVLFLDPINRKFDEIFIICSLNELHDTLTLAKVNAKH